MPVPRNSRWAASARVTFWAAALFATIMALLPQPPALPGGDKLQHMLAFLALTILAQAGWGRRARWTVAFWLSLFGAAIEVAQAAPVLHRDTDFHDWVADSAVILVVTMIFAVGDALYRPERSRPAPLPQDPD